MIPVAKDDYTQEFLDFWQLFPRRWIRSSDRYVKIGKELAWIQWEKLSAYNKAWAMFAVRKERVSEIIPDAWRWLRDKKYKDYDLEMPQIKSTIAQVATSKERRAKDPELVVKDKIQEQIQKLATHFSIDKQK